MMHLLHANILLSVLILQRLIVQSDAEASTTIRRAGRRALPELVQDLAEGDSPTTTSAESTGMSVVTVTSSAATSLSIDLAHGVEDAWFPTIPGVSETNNIPLKLGCKSCSTRGILTLTQSEWQFLEPSDWLNVDNLTQVIRAGYIQLGVEGFAAHLELQMEPDLTGSITVPLFTIPVAGFSIPGFGAGGLLFEPLLSIGWELAGGIDMSYGFELDVRTHCRAEVFESPTHKQEVPGLQLLIDFANPASSMVNGLDNVSLHDIPFQANISDIELSLSIALAPRISLGVELFQNLLNVQVGSSFDLPKTSVSITQLATESTDTQCEKSDGKPISPYATDFQHVYDNLTHIATEVELGVGFDMRAQVSALPRLDLSSSIEVLTVPVVTLPTQCLVFEAVASATPVFTPAASALKQIQVSASASAASASRASVAASQSSDSTVSNGANVEDSAAGRKFSGDGLPNSLGAFIVILSVMIL